MVQPDLDDEESQDDHDRYEELRDIPGDVRYAVRTLRQNVAFAAIVVMTLALGIGANAAIFSVVNAVVLRPLPYRDAQQLVALWGNLHRAGVTEIPASAGEFADYRDRARVFDRVAIYDTSGFNLTSNGDAERIDAAIVSPSLFALLGVAPEIGRAFLPDEERAGGDHVVVLSHGLWTRRFGAERSVLGKMITLDGAPAQIVGVMPASFCISERPRRSLEARADGRGRLEREQPRIARI